MATSTYSPIFASRKRLPLPASTFDELVEAKKRLVDGKLTGNFKGRLEESPCWAISPLGKDVNCLINVTLMNASLLGFEQFRQSFSKVGGVADFRSA